MKWRISLLVLSLLLTAASLYLAFKLWDSYADWSSGRQLSETITPTSYHASWNCRGRWVTAQAPVDIPDTGLWYARLVPNPSEFQTARLQLKHMFWQARDILNFLDKAPTISNGDRTLDINREPFEMPDRIFSEGAFFRIRLVPLDFFPNWFDSVKHLPRDEIIRDHPFPVIAVRYRIIRYDWVPPVLGSIAAILISVVAGPWGRIRATLTYLCLLFASICIIFWCRSHTAGANEIDSVVQCYNLPPLNEISFTSVNISRGNVVFTHWKTQFSEPEPGWYFGIILTPQQMPPSIEGFGLDRIFVPAGSKTLYDGWRLSFPLWLPTLLLLIYPALFTRRLIKHHRAKPNACATCGYDLRASPARCPECGTTISQPAPATIPQNPANLPPPPPGTL